jgi:SHO1 osmosensor
VNQGIFTNVGSLEAMAAGWLILAITNIVWLLYFTSEENSLSLHLFNTFGTGGLTGPGRNGFRPGGRRMTGSHVNMQNGGGAGYSSGIGGGPDYAPPNMMGGGISGGYDTKDPGVGGMDRSQKDTSQRSLGGVGSVNSNDPGSQGRGFVGGTASPSTVAPPLGPSPTSGDIQNPSTPLMASGNPGSSGDAASIPETYLYRAKALYACE